MDTLCSNHGIISFPTVKQRILGDQNCFTLAKMTPIRRLTSPFWTLPEPKLEPVVPFLSQNNAAFIAISGTEPSKSRSYGFQCLASLLLFASDAYNWLFLCGRMPFMPILCHTSCWKHGFIRFPPVKRTLLGGQGCCSLSFARWSFCLVLHVLHLNLILWPPSSVISM